MNPWNSISTSDALALILEKSKNLPVVVFKHSTRCSLSTVAKMRLENSWKSTSPIPLFLINVIESREISNALAEKLMVHHESPQVLLIHKGECVYESSHLDIRSNELSDQIKLL